MMWRSYIVFYCLIKSWFLAHPQVCVRLFCMSMPDQLHMYIYNSSKFISVHLVLFSCILQYTFLIYRMLWSPMKGEENVALHTQMFLELHVHQHWTLILHVFHTNMFTCSVCTGINSQNFMVDVGLCMINKGSQSWIKIVYRYTLKSTNICNIMILHSWVIGKAIHGTMCT